MGAMKDSEIDDVVNEALSESDAVDERVMSLTTARETPDCDPILTQMLVTNARLVEIAGLLRAVVVILGGRK